MDPKLPESPVPWRLGSLLFQPLAWQLPLLPPPHLLLSSLLFSAQVGLGKVSLAAEEAGVAGNERNPTSSHLSWQRRGRESQHLPLPFTQATSSDSWVPAHRPGGSPGWVPGGKITVTADCF